MKIDDIDLTVFQIHQSLQLALSAFFFYLVHQLFAYNQILLFWKSKEVIKNEIKIIKIYS